MRLRVLLTFLCAGLSVAPLLQAEETLQQKYLNIYLKINDAEHLEKQGDYRGALDDFKECYQKLAKIHQSDPNWETALVVHRMDDCKAKILDLQPKADSQGPSASVAATPPTLPGTGNTSIGGGSETQVTQLKLELQAVKQELTLTKQKLGDATTQLETYRTQLEAVNQQLAAVKNQQTADQKMASMLNKNKELSDKLAAAQAELDTFKNNPKSKLAQAVAQVKNLQDQLAASQEANKALQDTTTTLKQQLDQANADLVAANQKLAAAGTGSPEYATLKRENEIMRGILTRELQEQAHRDMAKRLIQEEFDNLKLKSKVLQENLDIASTPMTPPSTDEERQLLASLRNPSPEVTPAPPGAPNSFTAPAGPGSVAADTNTAPVAPTSTAPSPETNMAGTNPTPTNSTAAATPDNSTNAAPVQIVMSPDQTTNTPAATGTATMAAASPDVQISSGTATPTPDQSAPIPPTQIPGQPVAAITNSVATPPTPPVPDKTMSQVPPATTVYTDTTIKNSSPADNANDPTALSKQAKLPDDMRETAQQAADLFKNQKYDESAAKYQSIIDKYPESLYAWSNLGVVRFQQGKFDDALKALQQAVKLSPTDAFSYSNLGIVYYQLNQFENAIDALNAAKALDPNDPKTHNYLGCACSQKGWQEVAQKEFRKAIELDSNFGDAHFNLALVYATEKPPALEMARREYNRALELGIAKDPRLEKLLQGGTATAQTQPSQP